MAWQYDLVLGPSPGSHLGSRQLKAIHESTHPVRIHSEAAQELRSEIEEMQEEDKASNRRPWLDEIATGCSIGFSSTRGNSSCIHMTTSVAVTDLDSDTEASHRLPALAILNNNPLGHSGEGFVANCRHHVREEQAIDLFNAKGVEGDGLTFLPLAAVYKVQGRTEG